VAITDEYTADGRRFPVFLTAEWRNLAIVNWEVERSAVAPLVPRGTQLDDWRGRTYLSLVGFGRADEPRVPHGSRGFESHRLGDLSLACRRTP
jgi:uncharacterized protein YqjF (DUF2071 family)